ESGRIINRVPRPGAEGLQSQPLDASETSERSIHAGEQSKAIGEPVTVRPLNWEASNDVPNSWTRTGHAYRGMEAAEFNATVGKGLPIASLNRYSLASEGTNFSEHADTAEGYVNFGRSDPRKTGQPTYVVEVLRGDNWKPNRQGYLESHEPISTDKITRIWRMDANDGSVIASPIDVNTTLGRDSQPSSTIAPSNLLKSKQPAPLSADTLTSTSNLSTGELGPASDF